LRIALPTMASRSPRNRDGGYGRVAPAGAALGRSGSVSITILNTTSSVSPVVSYGRRPPITS
jgi:hypothetical protein